MVPTVTQQLSAMQDTMLRFVLPAIPVDQTFAREQAGLILASLGWLADVNESQQTMELQEHDDLIRLASAMLGLQFGDDAARTQLQRLSAAAPDADASVADLRCSSRELKALTARALDTISDADEARAIALFSNSGRRVVAREQAYGRMTGLVRHVDGSLAEVLAHQRKSEN